VVSVASLLVVAAFDCEWQQFLSVFFSSYKSTLPVYLLNNPAPTLAAEFTLSLERIVTEFLTAEDMTQCNISQGR